MIATDTNIKRMLQQLHDAAVDCFAQGVQRPYSFGMAISFITTTIATCNQLAREGRLPAGLEEAQRNLVADFVTSGRLNVIQSNAAPNEADNAAHYRHLRNCFAHGNWRYDESMISAANMVVTLEDYAGANRTFAATIDFAHLISFAEQLLVLTFDNMP